MSIETPDYLPIIADGLTPRAVRPRRVLILGAGMAGLVAAYELQRAGHEVEMMEARQRVGGRIETLREPFADGLYAEAGAMRLPLSHELAMAYVEKFRLPVQPFTSENEQAYVYLRGKRERLTALNADAALFDYDLKPEERAMNLGSLWLRTITPLVKQVEMQGAAGWAALAASHDQYSVREFLEVSGWSEGAIELYGLLSQQEALMNSSFLELFREEAGGYYTKLVELEGGMDTLPRSFLPALRSKIRFGAKVVALDQAPDGVTAHYRTSAGRWQATADYAVVTLPFPALRHVETLQPFSRAKERAIRQLHYDASAKILLQFRRRFWEDDDGIHGGGTFSDLPIRATYYPDHGRETGRGIVLASYTWAEDAQRWGSLPAEERLVQALEDFAEIHPQAAAEFEVGASKMWHDDEFAGGAFALFDPGQQSLLYEGITSTEGRFYFAGEHTSLCHAWIQGAIESGLRAARAIHERSFES